MKLKFFFLKLTNFSVIPEAIKKILKIFRVNDLRCTWDRPNKSTDFLYFYILLFFFFLFLSISFYFFLSFSLFSLSVSFFLSLSLSLSVFFFSFSVLIFTPHHCTSLFSFFLYCIKIYEFASFHLKEWILFPEERSSSKTGTDIIKWSTNLENASLRLFLDF